jgi:hypothetical protein
MLDGALSRTPKRPTFALPRATSGVDSEICTVLLEKLMVCSVALVDDLFFHALSRGKHYVSTNERNNEDQELDSEKKEPYRTQTSSSSSSIAQCTSVPRCRYQPCTQRHLSATVSTQVFVVRDTTPSVSIKNAEVAAETSAFGPILPIHQIPPRRGCSPNIKVFFRLTGGILF